MPTQVIAIFDIGKTNKKLLLFDESLKLVYQEEQKFPETRDEEGFECDDVTLMESWMKESLSRMLQQNKYAIGAVNFTTYGASLMHLDAQGAALTPVYNYLKPMPDGVMDGFYEQHGGVEEFSRKTASPALGLLNSGLQILWLKKTKPEIFSRIRTTLHLPQYVSYLFTGCATSEYTSIGCHTAMWDFDNNVYHAWLAKEGARLPQPAGNSTVLKGQVGDVVVKTGIGIHDSSASLVPYFKGTNDEFILISTGTWCIFMNPFNPEPLTADQLQQDSLCYMSINQQQVKSSRLFLGHIHDVNVDRLCQHFAMASDSYKRVVPDKGLCSWLLRKKEQVFFRNGVPLEYIDTGAALIGFQSFEEAYHQLVYDLVHLGMNSLQLIIPAHDNTKTVFISGGFARNELFTGFLASMLPGKKVVTTEIDNATALGAAMVVYEAAFGREVPEMDLNVRKIEGL
jgi:sugar (pentulose or hexulose) kinase